MIYALLVVALLILMPQRIKLLYIVLNEVGKYSCLKYESSHFCFVVVSSGSNFEK